MAPPTRQIFGAYCSADWSTRKNLHKELSYFGTGETFVFTLSPQRRRYPWVGVELGEKTPASAHMFMAASKQTLLIGGGLATYNDWSTRNHDFRYDGKLLLFNRLLYTQS